MATKEAIFTFTKDRPETLSITLESIQDTQYKKYVIDDSVHVSNQAGVLNLCKSYSDCSYLGKAEFQKFVSDYKIPFPEFSFLLRELGNINWNLGYSRNFALLFSRSLGLDKVLFTDDDIEVPNLKLIEELFQSIDNYQFAGASILGLVDDSVLGHIATDIGIMNERMLSGGFMVFNPNIIDNFFLNNYNEDWIWLFLQLKEKYYLQTGEVFQELTNPLTNYKSKVMFQEFGEIALDGILDLFKEGSYNSLTQLSFWERLVKEREEYLDLLIKKAVAGEKKIYIEIIEWIKSNSQKLNAPTFQSLFEKYFSDRILFQFLYK